VKPRIYLAGPSVFDPDWEAQANAMKAACEARGAVGLYPKDNQVDMPAEKIAHGLKIYEVDRDLVIECDGLVADFTPFRGPSADVGTAWEMGYAYGLGKAVAAFSRDRRDLRTRILEWMPQADDDSVEAIGWADNLMLCGSNVTAGPERMAHTLGGLYGSFEEALDACLTVLRAR
jgi:nucleoside 2-deoxyribosyltransferase